MALLDDVCKVLRTNHRDEVQDLIDAAKMDLKISGVKRIDETDPLIKRAITVYCKAHYGYDDPVMTERFERSYNMLKQHLALSVEYSLEEY